VLGGTGGTGQHVVTQALDAGHHVSRARARSGQGRRQHERFRIVDGEVKNVLALATRMRGQDAVISAIGRGKSFKSENLIAESVPGIIAAMQQNGVRRLIFTSALGVGDTYRDSPLLPRIFFRTLLRGVLRRQADRRPDDP
jgi:putative NADH-flavin reductase